MSDGSETGWALGDGPSSYNRRRRMVSREADSNGFIGLPRPFPGPQLSVCSVLWLQSTLVLTSCRYRARVFAAGVGQTYRRGATAATRHQAKGGLLRTRC